MKEKVEGETIIENENGERKFDPFHPLFKKRIIFLPNEIDDWTADEVIAKLLLLDDLDPEKEIYLYIKSQGGYLYPGLGIYDVIKLLRAPVCTIAVGMTASMATILLAAGKKGRRFALPHATIHMHRTLGGVPSDGDSKVTEISSKEIRRTQRLVYELFAKDTGQKEKKIEKDFDRDHYLSAEEAKEYGIVDEILTKLPEF